MDYRYKEHHAHVYFDLTQIQLAEEIAHKIKNFFHEVFVGTLQCKPVGPHTQPMFRVIFNDHIFSEFVQWMNFNKGNFSVLIHPVTGDSYKDHIEYAIWLGKQIEMNQEEMDYKKMNLKQLSSSTYKMQ